MRCPLLWLQAHHGTQASSIPSRARASTSGLAGDEAPADLSGQARVVGSSRLIELVPLVSCCCCCCRCLCVRAASLTRVCGVAVQLAAAEESRCSSLFCITPHYVGTMACTAGKAQGESSETAHWGPFLSVPILM